MNLMVLGIVIAVVGTSVELLADAEALTQHSMILWSLIAGSGGLVCYLANFKKDEELCPRKIARQALAALPMSAFLGPLSTYLVSRTFQSEPNLVLLAAVAFGVGLSGPYLLTNYGQQVMDAIGKFGVARARKEFGDDGDPE